MALVAAQADQVAAVVAAELDLEAAVALAQDARRGLGLAHDRERGQSGLFMQPYSARATTLYRSKLRGGAGARGARRLVDPAGGARGVPGGAALRRLRGRA